MLHRVTFLSFSRLDFGWRIEPEELLGAPIASIWYVSWTFVVMNDESIFSCFPGCHSEGVGLLVLKSARRRAWAFVSDREHTKR